MPSLTPVSPVGIHRLVSAWSPPRSHNKVSYLTGKPSKCTYCSRKKTENESLVTALVPPHNSSKQCSSLEAEEQIWQRTFHFLPHSRPPPHSHSPDSTHPRLLFTHPQAHPSSRSSPPVTLPPPSSAPPSTLRSGALSSSFSNPTAFFLRRWPLRDGKVPPRASLFLPPSH